MKTIFVNKGINLKQYLIIACLLFIGFDVYCDDNPISILTIQDIDYIRKFDLGHFLEEIKNSNDDLLIELYNNWGDSFMNMYNNATSENNEYLWDLHIEAYQQTIDYGLKNGVNRNYLMGIIISHSRLVYTQDRLLSTYSWLDKNEIEKRRKMYERGKNMVHLDDYNLVINNCTNIVIS